MLVLSMAIWTIMDTLKNLIIYKVTISLYVLAIILMRSSAKMEENHMVTIKKHVFLTYVCVYVYV